MGVWIYENTLRWKRKLSFRPTTIEFAAIHDICVSANGVTVSYYKKTHRQGRQTDKIVVFNPRDGDKNFSFTDGTKRHQYTKRQFACHLHTIIERVNDQVKLSELE